MATHVRDAAGKGRLRLINLEHLAALDVMEISNALHNSGGFSGALAAGTGYLLHDGRIHPHPSRPRHHRDPGASDPGPADLSPQIAGGDAVYQTKLTPIVMVIVTSAPATPASSISEANTPTQ